MIKFNNYCVSSNGTKARVSYSLDNRIDGRKCVTLYAKDYDRKLGAIFSAEYRNETDSMTDYFDAGKVVLFEDHPLYSIARAAATAAATAFRAKWQARHDAKYGVGKSA